VEIAIDSWCFGDWDGFIGDWRVLNNGGSIIAIGDRSVVADSGTSLS
jgi:hypothetical protein